jgi:hypothetical protein
MPTSVPRRARRAQVARPCSTLFYLWVSESSFPLQVPLFFIPSRVKSRVPFTRQTRPSASPSLCLDPLGLLTNATKYALPQNPPTDVAFVARPLATWAVVWTSSSSAMSLTIHSFNRHSYDTAFDLGFPLSILGFPLES